MNRGAFFYVCAEQVTLKNTKKKTKNKTKSVLDVSVSGVIQDLRNTEGKMKLDTGLIPTHLMSFLNLITCPERDRKKRKRKRVRSTSWQPLTEQWAF